MSIQAQLENFHCLLRSTEDVILALADPGKVKAFKMAFQAQVDTEAKAVQEAERYPEIKPVLERRIQETTRAWEEVMNSLDATNPDHQAALIKRQKALNTFRETSRAPGTTIK